MKGRKLVAVMERDDGGGIPRPPADCPKCDDEMEMIDDVHHKDGSVCRIMARNYAVMDRQSIAPLGRYAPSRDPYGR